MKLTLSKKISGISEGLLASFTDLILACLFLGFGSITDPRLGRSLNYTLAKIDERMQEINYRSLKRAISHAMDRGWIKGDLNITLEGQKRLKKILPGADYTKKWDGNWYLVSFDIPEKLRGKRNILRAVLRRLGFGRLQNSVWISPFNLLGDIEKTVDDLDIAPYVILSISDKVGREESRTLAGRIWHISAFQKEYLEFIQKCKTGKMS
ncbi:MAG: hypothetical protein Q8N56_03170, partial [bacterium]|nr:hypothetical protein [bacterium]